MIPLLCITFDVRAGVPIHPDHDRPQILVADPTTRVGRPIGLRRFEPTIGMEPQ